MKNFLIPVSAFSFFLISSCESPTSQETPIQTDSVAREDRTNVEENVNVVDGDTLRFMPRNGISLSALETVPEFMDAQLTLNKPEQNTNLKPGEATFNFDVKNYQLGEQTSKNGCGNCANSDKGQHIHFILNNEPYDALYEPVHKENLKEGTNVVLAFLSRSYHISLKHPDAYVLRKYTVGNASGDNFDQNAPHMFYSRPKGEYDKANDIVLDWFLVNTDLSKDGNRVRATINGATFTITRWMPYLINGMRQGENTIKLELLDKDGNLVESPFNPVERTITIKEQGAA